MVQSILWKIKSLYLIYVCLFADRKTNVSTHSLTSAFISYSATESVVHFPGPVSLGFDHKKFYSVAFLPMSISFLINVTMPQHHFSQYGYAGFIIVLLHIWCQFYTHVA